MVIRRNTSTGTPASNAKKATAKKIAAVAQSSSLRLVAPFKPLTSKTAQVVAAVSISLHVDGHWPPNDRKANMGATYHYTKNSMQMFFTRVKDILAQGTPPHSFSSNDALCLQAIGLSVEQLMVLIYQNTV